MSAFGPTSAPVANCGVLGFFEASGSYKIDYGRDTLNHNRQRTFETQLTHSERSGLSRIPFREALASGGVKTIPLPASPNLNAFAERWVRSVKQECLSKVILFGEGPLSRVLTEYSRHYLEQILIQETGL